MFKKTLNNKAFTFVELIVALILSSIIFLFLMDFISKTFVEISYSKNKTNIILQIYEFEDKISDIREKYSSGIILIDNEVGTGSDVLILKNDKINNGGYLIAQVDTKLKVIDGDDKVNIIGNKSIGIRKLSKKEIDNLLIVPNGVYNYNFNKDEIFDKIRLKDFQVNLYESGSIIESEFYINPLYKINMNGEKYSELGTKGIEKIVIDF